MYFSVKDMDHPVIDQRKMYLSGFDPPRYMKIYEEGVTDK